MPDGGVVNRLASQRAVDEFLTAASAKPNALLVEGEAGLGKTTLWLGAIEQACQRGFAVLSARAAAAESVLAYASVADLLRRIDPAVWTDLPEPQRLAVERVMLRTDSRAPATDPRVLAAGFLSIIDSLSAAVPVLIAVDDLQWLDSSSASVIAFAARRLSGPVGFLGTVRTEPGSDGGAWLQLPTPDAIRRVEVPPMSLGALHALISDRLGRSLPRPAMVRINDVSGGNPFYALELARVMNTARDADVVLPATLTELVRARLGGLGDKVQECLLAASCVATPTVDLIASAIGTNIETSTASLEQAEDQGIVEIDGARVSFAHPLLATGVYANATAARRRAMHRRLAQLVEEPELRARHLALAATGSDPVTLDALDEAAEMARRRGAPAAAAELLGLAMKLGGDSSQRRIRCASDHFKAGDPGRARQMLTDLVDGLPPGPIRAEALSQLGVVRLFDDSFVEAADLLERSLAEADDDTLRAQILVTLSFAQLNAGRLEDAMRSVEDAATHADALGDPQLLSQALGMRVVLRFMRGEGLDGTQLQRALDLERHQADIPVGFRPSMQNAILLGWTGQLDDAHREIAAVRRRCIEYGQENELMLVSLHSVLIEIWRGNFGEASLIAEDAMERARELGGDIPLSVALMIRAALASFAGQVDQARNDANEALAASLRHGSHILAMWPITTLGFLEVSVGAYQDAVATLEPLRAIISDAPESAEIVPAWFLPDLIEALVSLGRIDEAEPLVDHLERNGRRLDRPWMLSSGARCRSQILAARGDIEAATESVREAMAQYARLPMPFERARTELLFGQLLRRQRHKGAAATSLRGALRAFEDLNTPLWADRARAELDRATLDLTRTEQLTPSEQRVAELAASGMTNRDVAASLFISPKTVEANLSRIYRKLKIRSRAELGRHIDYPEV